MTRSCNDMETGKQNDSNANHTQESRKSQAIKEGKETSNSSEEDWNCLCVVIVELKFMI